MYEASHITHRYGALDVLSDVSVRIRSSEVHALLGANGAGKSTLMKILAGVLHPTAGTLSLDGERVAFANAGAALDQGIAFVSQELSVFPDLDVLENLFLTREPSHLGVVSRRQMRELARPRLRMVGLDEDLSGPLRNLRLGVRQRIEICRALIAEPRILILDEPTSALDASETNRLLEVVRTLCASGTGVVFVSHILEDVFAIADAITVLRDGRLVLDAAATGDVDTRMVVDAMLGERRELRRDGARRVAAANVQGDGPVALSLSGITIDGVLAPVNLDVRGGEIVALAGLEGSGRSTVLDIIYGRVRANAGEVGLPGGRGAPRSMADAVRHGVAFVPSDRGAIGLFADQTVAANIGTVRALAMSGRRMTLRTQEMRERAERRVQELDIRPHRTDIAVRALSGGNQQKVVFAKWLEAQPSVYLLDDPTRGVDIGTRAQMHEVIRSLADEGAVVLVTSSDLDELCVLADRALVFFHGRVVGEVEAEDLTPHRILEAINTGVLGDLPASPKAGGG